MKLLLGEWEKWFRTKGSVRNLYRKKSKRFRTYGFVPNLSRIMSKRFRTDGFALNPFRIISKRFRTDGFVLNSFRIMFKRFRTDGFVQNLSEESLKKVSSRWFRTKPFKAYSTHKEALPTEKSFSGWASVHKVDPGEIRKTTIACVSLAVPSKVLIILLEFYPNANEETEATVKSVLCLSPMCQIDLSEVWKTPKERALVSLLSRVIAILVEFYLITPSIPVNWMIVFLFEISPTKRSIYEENISKTSAQKNVFIPKILKLKDITHISRKMIKCSFFNFNVFRKNTLFWAEVFGIFSS
jgi:hypothetical protein